MVFKKNTNNGIGEQNISHKKCVSLTGTTSNPSMWEKKTPKEYLHSTIFAMSVYSMEEMRDSRDLIRYSVSSWVNHVRYRIYESN